MSDADLEAYYKDHAAQFQAPEQASVEYLVLDLDAAKKNIAVSEADLQAATTSRTAPASARPKSGAPATS